MSELIEIEGFITCLTNARIPYTLALTGSTARGELRNNSGRYDYDSDTDILCIIEPDSISATLSCKKNYTHSIPLILMSACALSHPSNAVLSIAFDSLITNDLSLSKPDFTNTSTAEFIAYQLQPLAYYTSQLKYSKPETQRRLYSKIAITCLKLLYLTQHPNKRSFIYEQELKLQGLTNIDEMLVQKILNRDLPDTELRDATERLEHQVTQFASIIAAADFLESTRLYILDKDNYSKRIIESIFLENNKLKRSDTLFIEAA
ncbi:hypothetical protein [Pseudomonas sp. S1Bt23]|uniref:hypothetical protein n=1 Tax=Pseudomonas sp. S1Bt23 TaxID=3095074 RepID=UPI002A5B07BF|nr:hypothetical protein [Pseudomonas sp. S1Bt23]WPO46644.1 hypothetical protein SHB59_25820 [Pseudomonas sp. S1Bt23]